MGPRGEGRGVIPDGDVEDVRSDGRRDGHVALALFGDENAGDLTDRFLKLGLFVAEAPVS